MPNIWEIPVNDETEDKDLYLMIAAARHSSDKNILIAAANAEVELRRRKDHYEREEYEIRQNIESSERINSLRVQERLQKEQMDFQSGQFDKQLEVSRNQNRIAKYALIVAILMVSVTVFTTVNNIWPTTAQSSEKTGAE